MAVFIFLIIVCMTLYLRAQPNPYAFMGQISYKGPINIAAYEKIKSIYDDAKKKPTKLKINSLGGSSLAGILIGRFIHENSLDVIVDKNCHSSCANFVFTAAREKVISHHALIVFHGGSFQKNIKRQRILLIEGEVQKIPISFNNQGKEAIASFSDNELKISKYFPKYENSCSKDYLISTDIFIEKRVEKCTAFLQNIERNFYIMLNVDPMISYYGQQNEYEELYKSYKYIGFYYDLDSLSNMGVKNISIRGDKLNVSDNDLSNKVYLVSVSESD